MNLTDAPPIAMGALALDPNTNLEERPGEIDFCHYSMDPIWCSTASYESMVQTTISCVDVNADGVDEVVFGTQDGRLVVVDPVSKLTLLDVKLANGCFLSIDVGNLDDDPGIEIVCIAGWNGTVSCVDFEKGAVEWRHLMDNPPNHVSLFDDDGDGRMDVFASGSAAYMRINGSGDMAYEGSLDIFNGHPWIISPHVIDDLDGDGDVEVLMVDTGYGWEWGQNGEHLWVIDLGTGTIEYALDYPGLRFSSPPVMVSVNGKGYIAVGLTPSKSGGNDLFVLDLASMERTLLNLTADIYPNERWDRIAVVPTREGPLLFLGMDRGACMAWRFSTGETMRVVPESPMYSGSRPTIIACDIDNDTEYEGISEYDGVCVRGIMTGDSEFSTNLYPIDRVACGDIDGDGFTEICFDAYHYDFLSSSNIIYVMDSPKNPEWEVSVQNGTATLYAAIESNITLVVENMTRAYVPPALALAIANPEWGEFSTVLLDIGNATMSTSGDLRLNVGTLEVVPYGTDLMLRLTLSPSWGFSYERPNDIHVRFHDRRGRSHDCLVAEAFRVERDLAFAGNLTMTGMDGPIPNGSWVRAGDWIRIDGIEVVYEGATDVHPAMSAYSILVMAGDQWFEKSFCPDDALSAFVFAPARHGPFVVRLVVNETLAGIRGRSSNDLCLRVDTMAPDVIEPEALGRWYSAVPVEVEVHLDEPDSGLDLTGVRYATILNQSGSNIAWQRVLSKDFGVLASGDGAEGTHWIRLSLTLPEGKGYLIIEATDRLGNSGRHFFPVMMDRMKPEISFEPPVGWVVTDTVDVRVTVKDLGGSGIDVSSVEMSFSQSDPPDFNLWYHMDVEGAGECVCATFAYPGVQGRSNHLMFRARDNVGNEALTTDFAVWIDSTPPQVIIEDPLDGTLFYPPWSDMAIHVRVREDGSGVDRLKPMLIDAVTGLEQTTMLDETRDPRTGDIRVTVVWFSRTSPRYTFTLLCSDIAGNSVATRPITINLNMPPTISTMMPPDGTRLDLGASANFSATASDPNGPLGPLAYSWMLDGRLLAKWSPYFTTDALPLGTSKVTVVVTDGFYFANASVNVTVVGPPPADDGGGGDGGSGTAMYSPMMGIIAIAGLLVVIAVLWGLGKMKAG